jgi:hypothetical protein
MGSTDVLKEARKKICKMLDECHGCTKSVEPKLVQLDLCKTCTHWASIQDQRIRLEKLQKIYRNQRSSRNDKMNIS